MLNSSPLASLRAKRLVVWLLFVTVLLGGGLLASSDLGRVAPSPLPTAAVSSVPVGDSVPVSVNTNAGIFSASGADLSAPRILAAPQEGGGLNASQSSKAINDLPAWRWNNFELDAAGGGFLDAAGGLRSAGSTAATVLFFGAALIWKATLGLLQFGISAYFVDTVAPSINSGINSIANYLLIFLGAVWAFVLFKMIRSLSKGQAKQMIGSFLLFTLAAGGIAWSAQASDGGNSRTSPTGIVSSVVSQLDRAGAKLGSGFGIANADNYQTTARSQSGNLTCAKYITALHDTYSDRNAGSSANPATIGLVSKLWETTFFNSWTSAQHGSSPTGARVACHQAEAQSDLPVATASHNMDVPVGQRNMALRAYGNTFQGDASNPIFGPLNGEDDVRKAVTGWAACDGGSTVRAGFEVNGINGDVCQKFFEGDLGDQLLIHYKNRDAFDDVSASSAAAVEAQEWNQAYYGQNTADRFTQGLLALIVSVVFLFALGFLGLGMVAVQFMLVVLLVLLPVAFMFLAMGMEQGPRMLKLLGTTAASKFLFAILLALITEMIALGQKMVAAMGVQGGGIIEQLAYGLMPLLALFAISKVLKNVGLGDILKPTGALSFMAASSMAATRDKSLVNMVKTANQDGGSLAKAGAIAAAGKNSKLAQKLDRLDKTATVSRWTKEGREEELLRSQQERRSSEHRKSRADEERSRRKEQLRSQVGDLRDKFSFARDPEKPVGLEGVSRTRQFGALLKAGEFGAIGNSMLSSVREATRSERFQSVTNNLQRMSVGTAAGGGLLAGGAALAGLAAAPILAPAAAIAGGAAATVAGAKVLSRFLESRDITPNEVLVNEDRYATDVAAARRDSKADARRVGTDPAAIEPFVGSALGGVVANRMGDDFLGFTSKADELGARNAYAHLMGLNGDEVISSNSGLMVPRPMSKEDARGALSRDQMANGFYWLDEETKAKRSGESDDDYTARITVAMAHRGLITREGAFVNVFEKMGFDLDKPADVERIDAWLKDSSKTDSLLDNFRVESRDSSLESNLTAAAKKWQSDRSQAAKAIQEESQQKIVAALASAETDRDDFQSKLSGAIEKFTSLNDNFSQERERLVRIVATGNDAQRQEANKRLVEIDVAYEGGSADALRYLYETDDVNQLIRAQVEARYQGLTPEETASLAEGLSDALEERMAGLVSLQTAAMAGGAAEARAFQDALVRAYEVIKDDSKNIDAAKREAQAEVARQAAVAQGDLARVGAQQTVTRASDMIGGRRGFPSASQGVPAQGTERTPARSRA